MRRTWLAALLVFGLVLPFVQKPVHVDDTNFLALARGAAADPWRPHAITINWQGHAEPAFDVLSNPPGVAWWLAPVATAPVEIQHLWMLPWLALALWGARRLGEAFGVDGDETLLLVGTAPITVLAAQSLTPDLPLLACTLAGVGGFAATRAPQWALLAGCAALFRYSGLCLIPLLFLFGGPRAWPVLLPSLALGLHDLEAYGRLHVLAMGSFQSVSDTPRELFRKLVASLEMLGGAGFLPILGVPLGALPGLILGAAAAALSGQSGAAAAATVLFGAAGGMSFATVLRADRRLLAWGLGGLIFLVLLRFTAARYWLPFLPAFVLAAQRAAPGRGRVAAAVALSAALSLALSIADLRLAQAQEALAKAVIPLGPGVFAGHWGWQHHLEMAGWRALEDDAIPDFPLASSEAAWPQPPADTCIKTTHEYVVDPGWGLRVHSAGGGANLHAFLVAGDPPVETYAPWTISDDPLDRVRVYEGCNTSLPEAQGGQDAR